MEILQKGAPILRSRAEPLPERFFGTPELEKVIARMREALDKEEDGVALAAPQVGIPYRLFIVRRDRLLPSPPEGAPARAKDVEVYVNPELTRRSRKSRKCDEGCLSVRGVYGTTKRPERATIRAKDANGKAFTRGGGGVTAQIFAHEIDHLNGVLFTDHATDLVEIKHAQPA